MVTLLIFTYKSVYHIVWNFGGQLILAIWWFLEKLQNKTTINFQKPCLYHTHNKYSPKFNHKIQFLEVFAKIFHRQNFPLYGMYAIRTVRREVRGVCLNPPFWGTKYIVPRIDFYTCQLTSFTFDSLKTTFLTSVKASLVKRRVRGTACLTKCHTYLIVIMFVFLIIFNLCTIIGMLINHAPMNN